MDTQPGRSYSPKFRIIDSKGSPVVSGMTGTMTVFAPSSATTPVINAGTLTYVGTASEPGYWGVAASSLFTETGAYRWQTSALTGTVSWGAQYGSFLVGRTDEMMLREVYTLVRRGLRDGRTGTTTNSGTTGTLQDTKFAVGADDEWVGSEIYFFEPQSAADANPVRVTDFNPSVGIFSFTPAITSTISGLDFILGNLQTHGWDHDEVMDAITGACRRRRVPRKVVDQVLTTTSTGTFEYAAPAGWVGIDRVEYQPWSGWATDWRGIAKPLAPFNPTTGILTLTLVPPYNALRLTGRALPSLPALMTDLVPGDGTLVAEDAIYELLRMSDRTTDRQRAAMMAPAVERARAGAALARL